MKEEMKIEELLNSFVDGELTAREETEVQRLIDNDPQIAQRLRQLQKCRVLMSALPVADAPAHILDNIKSSLETKAQQDMPELISQERIRPRSLLAQRIVAVAALIGLVVVLTAVLYTFAPPGTTPERPDATAVKDFRGKLELKTSDFVAVDAFINRVIEDKGLSGSLTPTREPNRRIYTLKCSKQGMNLLLADMRNIWSKLDTTTLFVDTEVFGEQIIIEAVTTEQIAKIISQNDSNKYIEIAKDFAVLNNMAKHLPGREIVSAIEVSTDDLIAIPKPVLTSKPPKTKEPAPISEAQKTIQLTIIINR
jgi:hypothetical protein